MLNSFGRGNGRENGVNLDAIKAAALETFSERGYSGTTFEEICARCGATNKQITQFFNSKEKLFETVLIENTDIDSVVSYCSSVLEMFAALLEELVAESIEEATLIKFLNMLLRSSSIPRETRELFSARIMGTRFYKAVDAARIQGIITGPDTLGIIKKFVKSSLSIIEGYRLAGAVIPEADWFISTILFDRKQKDDSLEEIVKKQNSIIATFVSDYQSILFVDLDTKTVSVYQTNGDDDVAIKKAASRGYGELRRSFAEEYLYPEDVEWFLKETDPINIIDRLMDDPVLYIEHRIRYNGKPCFYQTVIALDPLYSTGNKIVMGGHRIRKNQVPGVNIPSDPEENTVKCIEN